MKGSHLNIDYLVKVNKQEELGGYSASFSFTPTETSKNNANQKAYELMNSDKSLSIFKSKEEAAIAAEKCVRVCIDDGFVN
ncbi:hypothetical protein LRP50_15230 [Enterovibrio sp. ZSDZ42]|uniref:Uncharacterized protein n=1 Tax=Enterovibrio gelatinilyticus TaxID=2899819 RepID=A0ABT5R3Y8_9GAMM|nr:hypothetical protein [Enterovibrio sp. ZSDZ42]MDD1794486.1 hypothetical protein [Enterovibrio sp. ZSDZ42]